MPKQIFENIPQGINAPNYEWFRLKGNDDSIFRATPQGVEQYSIRYQPNSYKAAQYPLSESVFKSLPEYNPEIMARDVPQMRVISRQSVTPYNVSQIENTIKSSTRETAPDYKDPMIGKSGGGGGGAGLAPDSVLQNAINYFNKFPGTTEFGPYKKQANGNIIDASASGGGKVVGNIATSAVSTTGAPAGGVTPSITPPPATSAFKNSATYKALSADAQALVDLAYSTFAGTPEQQNIFANALTQAQALADPYAKAQLALSLGEFQSKIAFTQGDLERASEIITRTRDEISQDVSAGKEFLTLEQQAEISKEARGYDEDLLTIADQAAEKGITFATGAQSRTLAETRRTEQYADVIQSSQRQYNFKIKELELKAARGETAAQKQLEDLRAKSSFNLEQIGRSAEQVLGTSNLPATPGYTPVGGVLGDIEQKRREAVISAAKLGLPQ